MPYNCEKIDSETGMQCRWAAEHGGTHSFPPAEPIQLLLLIHRAKRLAIKLDLVHTESELLHAVETLHREEPITKVYEMERKHWRPL